MKSDTSDDSLWIGGTDAGSYRDFYWVSTNIPITNCFVNWNIIEPNGDQESCIEFYDTADWNDELCGESRRFACQSCKPCRLDIVV